jgi:hypothetical protein
MTGKVPRALPWAGMRCPFGTRRTLDNSCPKKGSFPRAPQRGAAYQPRVKPWVDVAPPHSGVLKERRIFRLSIANACGLYDGHGKDCPGERSDKNFCNSASLINIWRRGPQGRFAKRPNFVKGLPGLVWVSPCQKPIPPLPRSRQLSGQALHLPRFRCWQALCLP